MAGTLVTVVYQHRDADVNAMRLRITGGVRYTPRHYTMLLWRAPLKTVSRDNIDVLSYAVNEEWLSSYGLLLSSLHY